MKQRKKIAYFNYFLLTDNTDLYFFLPSGLNNPKDMVYRAAKDNSDYCPKAIIVE
jgi:hypothetical protein